MGLFGRKTVKVGPFRMTVSRSGVSTSAGVKGARVRANSNGRKSVSVGRKGFRFTRSKG
jgi:hypothetical protein